MDEEKESPKKAPKRAAKPKGPSKAEKDEAKEVAAKALETLEKNSVEQNYYHFLLELTGRYDTDDLCFVPHVLDREQLVSYVSSEVPDDNAPILALEENLLNTVERQIRLLAAGETIEHKEDEKPREKLFCIFSRHAVWLKVFAAARRLWDAHAFLPLNSENRDRLSRRYGYYASSIAVFMNTTRLMPPAELFVGLAAAAPEFATACTDHDPETQHTVSAIPKTGGPALHAVRATKSIRASFTALLNIADNRLPGNARGISAEERTAFTKALTDMSTDFYGFISSPEKLTRARDVERLLCAHGKLIPDAAEQTEPLCLTTIGVIRTMHERWLDAHETEPVDAALRADLRGFLTVFCKILDTYGDDESGAKKVVKHACARFVRTCVEPLELLPPEIADILEKRKPKKKDPEKKNTTPKTLLKMLEAPNGAWGRLVALRKVQHRPPAEAREAFASNRAAVEMYKSAVEELNSEEKEEEEEEGEEEDEDEEEEDNGDE